MFCIAETVILSTSMVTIIQATWEEESWLGVAHVYM